MFIKDKKYYTNRIENLKEAIKGNKESLKKQTDPRAIQAHKSYIKELNRTLKELKTKQGEEDE